MTQGPFAFLRLTIVSTKGSKRQQLNCTYCTVFIRARRCTQDFETSASQQVYTTKIESLHEDHYQTLHRLIIGTRSHRIRTYRTLLSNPHTVVSDEC